MGKLVIISNRLPVMIAGHRGSFDFHKSMDGLANGLRSYQKSADSIWVGWPGLARDILTGQDQARLRTELREKYRCVPVFLSQHEVDSFYHGFCHKTIWPLFHYFTMNVQYSKTMWETYIQVNRRFLDCAAPLIEEGDIVWVHGYQLMLLPQMIRERFPNVKLGFFMHIPFPSFEIYRLLIWREELLSGLLGADVIGFHTYDYVRHFLSSVHRLLGYEHTLNQIAYANRSIRVDAFPMGIDYDRFSKAYNTPKFQETVRWITQNTRAKTTVLSLDRLDYTKGLPQRARAFTTFLQKYPEYKGQICLRFIVAPPRGENEALEPLKRELVRLITETNNALGTADWTPILFHFQDFSYESLTALYKYSDILLATPLRDGMNLVAKEYIAARTDYKGMVVISETAGAASELGEVIIVNPNDSEAVADGIKRALDMPAEDKIEINKILHQRLRRYNVNFWAETFVKAIAESGKGAEQSAVQDIEADPSALISAYSNAQSRIILLDYDGTLVGFKAVPNQARPDPALKKLLFKLAEDPKNTVVIVSGRDRHSLEEWLGDLRLYMLAAHGLWRRELDGEWIMTAALDNRWKEQVAGIMQLYADRMPGALIEEKDYSLAFHYRNCEPNLVADRLGEIRSALSSAIGSMSLGIQEGNKVLEIKDTRIDKGQSVAFFTARRTYDFVLGIGDDYTDENLFAALGPRAFSVKIGPGRTGAKYRLHSWQSVRGLLKKFTGEE